MARYQRYDQDLKHCVLADNWAEPYTLDELAVDTRKVDEITSWLSSHRNKSGILLITGPTGCGKTAAIKCISQSLAFQIREWITPLDRDYHNGIDSGVYQNQAEKFEEYLYSSSRYGDLFVKSSKIASLLLVEDYPNIFLRSPNVFHDVLRRYCETARAPIVFICSDVSDKDLKIENDLFPAKVKTTLGISQILLNPITRTKMLHALKRMGSILQTVSPGFKIPSQDVLCEICDSANGDVRYATLSLQMKPQEDVVSIFDSVGKRGQSKKGANFKKLTKEEEAVATCGKDDRVGILHAVGRVLYPKWLVAGEKPQNSNVRRKRKIGDKVLHASVPGVEWVHDPSTIADPYVSSASTFLLFVQENYLKTFSEIESVSAAALCLSESDVLMEGEGYENSHEISLNIGIRGAMVHNKIPNRAWNPVRGSQYYQIANIQKVISNVSEKLFPLYPVSHTILMTEIIPYMSQFCGGCLSNDQHKFVKKVACMETLSQFCESFNVVKEPNREKQLDRASFVINPIKQPTQQNEDDELHISEDDTDEEVDEGAENLTMLEAALNEEEDEGAENLTMLEAAINEEEQNEVDYSAMLNNSDDDEILSQI